MAKPLNPSSLTAKYNEAADAVMLSWVLPASSPPTTEIKIQRWVDTTQLYSDLATVSPQSPYIDTSITDGRTYAYRVLAINADGSPRFYSTPSNKVLIIATPDSPEEVKAERNTNNSIGLNWENEESVLKPLWYHYIHRWDNVSNKLTQINRISGSLQYYLDSTAPLDRALRYRVHSSNRAGGARYMSPYSGTVYTTPASATNLVASWSGSDIVVKWSNPSKIAVGFNVEHSTDGTNWFPMATLGKVTTWRHVAPERGVPHRYRVRPVSPTPTVGDAVVGAWTTSATVPAQSTPNAPTILGPTYAAANSAFTLSIRHNPVDGAEMGAAQLQHRAAGSSTWSATVAGLTVPAYASGSVEVRVATRTTTSAFGVWSAPHTVGLRSRPSPSVSSPTASQVVTGPLLPLVWNASSQTAWEAVLVENGTDVQAASGSTEKSTTFAVEDGKSYTVKLRVSDGFLWSNWVSRNITTSFSGPGAPVLTLAKDRDNLNVTAHVAAVTGAVRYEVQRRVAGSTDPWVLVGETNSYGYVLDPRPPLGVELEYVALAWNSAGGASTSPAKIITVDRHVAVVNFGPGLSASAYVEVDIAPLQMPIRRERALHQFAHRTLPVEVLGTAKTRSVRISGRVVDEIGSPPQVWDEMLDADGTKWFRDPEGRSYKCSIESVQITQEAEWMTVEFTADEVA